MEGYRVGQKYPQYANRKECMVCEYDQSGLYFLQFLQKPTAKEKRAFKGDLRLGAAVVGSVICFTMFYGDVLDFDCTFDPGFSKFARPYLHLFPEWADNESEEILAPIFTFDSSNGELISIRMISLNHKISREIVELCRSAEPIHPEDHTYTVQMILDKYSTRDLRQIALQQGLTETYLR